MGIIVGALGGAALCGAIGAFILATNWRYAVKQRQVGTVAGYAIIGGAVAGAIIGVLL